MFIAVEAERHQNLRIRVKFPIKKNPRDLLQDKQPVKKENRMVAIKQDIGAKIDNPLMARDAIDKMKMLKHKKVRQLTAQQVVNKQ